MEYASQKVSRTSFATTWKSGAGDLFVWVGRVCGRLLEDRLDSQRLDPPRVPLNTGFRLDLLHQTSHPLPVLLRRAIRQQGSGDSTSSSSVVYFSRPKSSPRLRAAYSWVGSEELGPASKDCGEDPSKLRLA
jgi:hypothetical protein